MRSLILLLIASHLAAPVTLSAVVGTKTRSLRHGDSFIISVQYLHHRRLISASFDGTVIMWDMNTRKPLWKTDLDAEFKTSTTYTISNIMGMAVSYDERFVAVSYSRDLVIENTAQGKNEYRIALLDAKDGRRLRSIGKHTDLVAKPAFSPAGEHVITVSSDKTARLWDIETGRELWSVDLKGRGHAVAFSGDGRFIAIGALGADNSWLPVIEIRNSENGKLINEVKQTKLDIDDLAFSKDGKLLAVVSSDDEGSQVDLWDFGTQRLKQSFLERSSNDTCVALSSDNRFLVTGGSVGGEGIITVRDLIKGRRSVRRLKMEVTSIAVSDEGTVAAGTEHGQIFVGPKPT